MTKRELDQLGALCISYLSRCTPSGIEKLKRYHQDTIQLLRWYRQNMVEIGPACTTSLNMLIDHIKGMSGDTTLVRPTSHQPTLDWMEVPL